MYILIIGLILFIIYGIIEFNTHQYYRKKIPLIIHINGTRGKSSVTRLIAAGLRAGGKKVIAKTTGSAPRIIFSDGRENPVVRFFGANIKEQLKIIKFAAKRKADILVLECMAVTPEYQWVTEHQMVKADIGVMTNTRLDHLDVMGPGIRNCVLSLCNTLPKNRLAYTSEINMYPLMKKESVRVNSNLSYIPFDHITDEMVSGFNHLEHKENIALSLKVCEQCGVDKDKALKEMYLATPDIGATEIFHYITPNKGIEILFAHSFAANDPESTYALLKYILKIYGNQVDEIAFVLNTRADRMFRSNQLIEMIPQFDKYDFLYLIGDQEKTIKNYGIKKNIMKEKIITCGVVTGEDLVSHVEKTAKSKKIILLGIGNIGGNGGIVVDYFNKNKKIV